MSLVGLSGEGAYAFSCLTVHNATRCTASRICIFSSEELYSHFSVFIGSGSGLASIRTFSLYIYMVELDCTDHKFSILQIMRSVEY